MKNIIETDNGDLIGYYSDLSAELYNMAKGELDNLCMYDTQEVIDKLELLKELDDNWEDYDGLLVLSENNGMGYTIREYKKEKTGEQKIDKQELVKELDDLCKRLQDDYNGVKEFKQYEEDRLVVYDVIELLEKGE